MQPYQEASQEIRRQGERPTKIAKTAGAVALSYGTAAGLTRALPLLSSHVPEDLAVKGLSKIDSRFGTFIEKAKQAGQSFTDIKDFIKRKAFGEEDTTEAPKEDRNIIQQYSPELHEFILSELQQGETLEQAGATAQVLGNYKDSIKKLEKDHKTNWSSILQNVYGNMQNATSKAALQPEAQAQQPGQGQGQQALMNILQQINQIRGG